MHRRIEIAHVDAFTRTHFTGNPAAVVLDAATLTDGETRAIAREMGHIDTAFVLAPDGADHQLRLRFFTPRGETAFIGHATVAVHAALSRRAYQGHCVQKQRSGLVDIEVRGQGDDERFVSFRQPAATLGRTLEPSECERVLSALGVPASELDERCPLQIAGGTSTRLLIGLDSAATLGTVTPDMQRLAALSPQLGAAGYFLFSLAPALEDVRTEARMFAPALGIDEDPVSGNAHGMLMAYGFEHGLLTADELTAGFTCAQGHHMGRPGRLTVHGGVVDGVLEATRIGGHAVVLYEAVLDLPG